MQKSDNGKRGELCWNSHSEVAVSETSDAGNGRIAAKRGHDGPERNRKRNIESRK